MKNRIRYYFLLFLIGLVLIGCGKKQTEYEKALEVAPKLSEKEQKFLEENWYGSDWNYYNQWTGEVGQGGYVIDEQYYGGKEPYVIKNCDVENFYVDYELFDLDTGASHGIWRDSISKDSDGITRIYSSSRTVEGVTSPSLLFRKTR